MKTNDYQKLDLMRRRCETMILSLVGAELAPNWWRGQNLAFDMRTPEEQWIIDPESVYKYVCGTVDGYW